MRARTCEGLSGLAETTVERTAGRIEAAAGWWDVLAQLGPLASSVDTPALNYLALQKTIVFNRQLLIFQGALE